MQNIVKIRSTLFFCMFATLSLVISLINAQSTGFTVQSVSLTNILHPGQQQNASQTQWLINVVANGGGQSTEFSSSISNSSVGQSCSNCQGDTPASTLTISGTENPEIETYPIEQTEGSLVQYDYYAEIGYLSASQGFFSSTFNATPSNPCPGSDPNQAGYVYSNEWDYAVPTSSSTFFGLISQENYTGTTVIRICIYSKKQGTVNQLDTSPYLKFSTTLTFSNSNGQTETLSLNSANQSGTAQTSDGYVYVDWPGSLVTGNPTTYSQGEVAVDNYQSQSWVISSSTDYQTYESDSVRALDLLNPNNNQVTTFENNTLSNLQCTGLARTLLPSQYNYTNTALGALTNCMIAKVESDYNNNNNDVQGLLNGGSSLSGYPAQFNSGSQPSFSISIPDYFVTNPELDLRVSGTFLGVVIPLGKPQILSISSTPFKSGGNGTITLNVQNIGSGTGTFYYSLNSCNGITAPTSSHYSVAPNNNQEISIPIQATSANQTISESCTVTVTDYNGGGSDSAQVSISVSPPNQCTPNSQVVQGSSICPCVEENGLWKISTSCTVCSNGVLTNGTSDYCESPPQVVSNKNNNNIQQNKNNSIPSPSPNQTLSHSDVVIVTIGSKLNEDSSYKNALNGYENILSSEGLSYTYIELNSYNPNMNINSWQSIKSTINKIEYETTPTYLIILGGTNIVPMPNVSVSIDFGDPNPYSIPTDDPYGSLYNNSIPSIVVARIPGSNADQIADFLMNDINRRQNGNAGDNNMMIVGDYANTPNDSFVTYDTNLFSEATSGSNCDSNSNCFQAPPNCLGITCTDSSQFSNYISNVYGIQYYDCHGDGYDCGDYYLGYPIVSSGLITLNGVPDSGLPSLNTNPIVMSAACYDGSIADYSPYPQSSLGQETLALAFLSKGASAYIGNTKEGYGPEQPGTLSLTPGELAYIYTKMKSGDTIGEAFLAMKEQFLNNPYDPYTAGTAQELQLYGDPTLTISG